MRTNIYKERILKLLQKKHLLTLTDIHKAIPEANYSTVFRNVEQLLKDKMIKKVAIDTKLIAYESVQNRHDHFICNDCDTVEAITISHGSIKGHTVDDITVRGSCNECSK